MQDIACRTSDLFFSNFLEGISLGQYHTFSTTFFCLQGRIANRSCMAWGYASLPFRRRYSTFHSLWIGTCDHPPPSLRVGDLSTRGRASPALGQLGHGCRTLPFTCRDSTCKPRHSRREFLLSSDDPLGSIGAKGIHPPFGTETASFSNRN